MDKILNLLGNVNIESATATELVKWYVIGNILHSIVVIVGMGVLFFGLFYALKKWGLFDNGTI